jgi:hypothetical protein
MILQIFAKLGQLRRFLNALAFGMLLFLVFSFSFHDPVFSESATATVNTPQFAMPGDFFPPFEFLNDIPEAGLDIDSNGIIDIITPCSCRPELPVPNGTNSDAGIFDNQLIVATGVSGQIWRIAISVNVLNPNTLTPFLENTLIPEVGNTGIYVLPFAHSESQEFQVFVKESTDPDQLVGPVINQCFYPDPEIVNLGDFYCDDEDDIILLALTTSPFDGNDNLIFGIDNFWTITRQENGQTYYTSIFSPSTLGEGTYTVRFTFNLGPVGFYADNKTGCSRTVEKQVRVREAYQMVCFNQINVALNPNSCEVIVPPSFLLAVPPETDSAFSINVVPQSGEDLGNVISAEYVGQTLTANITDDCSGIFCSTLITLTDVVAPTLNIPPDTTISCTETWEPELMGFAEGFDCTDVTVEYVDEFIEDECGDPIAYVERTWTATDLSGNATTEVQTIAIARGTQQQMLFPEDVTFECSDYLADQTIIDPENAGRPSLVNEPLCGLIFTYTDEVIELCGNGENSFLILRNWLVLDACGNFLFDTDGAGNDNLQIIRVEDNTAPDIESPLITLSANVPPQENGLTYCTTLGYIAPPSVFDECNDYTIRIYTPLGEANYVNGINGNEGGTVPGPGLPLGNFTVTFEVTDACGNTSYSDVPVIVEDILPPIMICNDNITVSLQPSGFGQVSALQIDEGVRDDCCLDEILIKLEEEPDSLFRNNIDFFCTNDTVQVLMRGWDCSGNFNNCSVTVYVRDNIPPQIIQNVSDIQLTCLDDYSAYFQEGFQAPTFADNCDFNVSYEVVEDVDDCGIGTLTRTWTASDVPENVPAIVTQTIFMNALHQYQLNIPEDETPDCLETDFGAVSFTQSGCDMITVNMVQDTLQDGGIGVCRIIQRTYSIINWCEYDGQSDPLELPRLTGNESNPLPAQGYVLQSVNDSLFRETFVDQVYLGPSPGNFTYTQFIYLNDDLAPEFISVTAETSFCMNETPLELEECTAYVEYVFAVSDNCALFPEVTYQHSFGEGAFGEDNFGILSDLGDNTYQIRGNYPQGQNSFQFNFTDECGNTDLFQYDFEVIDCTPPQLACLDTLVVQVEGEMTTVLTVNDLLEGVADNCGEPLSSFTSDMLIDSMFFDCETLGDTLLTVWGLDDAGNQSSCIVAVEVDNASLSCFDFYTIDGFIRTEEGEPVKGVTVTLTGAMTAQETTDSTGYYRFEDILGGFNYTVEPFRDGDDVNGVTTFDLILIQKHILDVQPFPSAYKIIASDVNKSNIVSTFDLLKLRKLILGVDPELEANNSWRFVETNYIFQDIEFPLQENFPETRFIDQLTGDMNIDFLGMKIGDVNASANLQGD